MNRPTRPLSAWIALGLLAALLVTNVLLMILLQTGGPVVGLLLYSTLVWRWNKGDFQAGLIGGIVGLLVHAVEIVITGWSTYPVLMALNLILPALLASAAWLADR
jgi:hypothetical protein